MTIMGLWAGRPLHRSGAVTGSEAKQRAGVCRAGGGWDKVGVRNMKVH